jgi:outer membrane protein assembly factor BamE (lipoprotein component of BamABCDE complex)
MKNHLKRLIVAISIVILAGCAGANFKRPEPGALEVGKSTASQVSQIMGSPARTGESLRNGEKLKVMSYAHAEAAGAGKYPGVVPARAMTFTTHNDRLVADEFISSFSTDATDFDDSKMSGIVKGKTTRDEVVALLGKPNGNAIYPYIKINGESASIYSYTHVKGNVFNMKLYSKRLVVSFDPQGIVSDIEFTSSGEK